MRRIETVFIVVFLVMVGYASTLLFKELATVQPNVERILLNK